jgi:hypothetical protein
MTIIGKYCCRRFNPQAAITQNPQRRFMFPPRQTTGERWVIRQSGPAADHNRIMIGPQTMPLGPCLWARDPFAVAAVGGNATIQRRRKFQRDKGPVTFNTAQKTGI